MQRIWLVLFLVVIGCSAFSQTMLDRLVSVKFENTTLEKALYDLMDHSDINLSFSNSIIPRDKMVTLTLRNQPLRTALDFMLDGTMLSYEVLRTQIVIVQKKPPVVLKTYTVSGFVRDELSGERVIGAVIYEAEKGFGTYSNEFGFYNLRLPEGKNQIISSYLGYRPDTFELELLSNLDKEISLKPAYLTQIEVFALADSVALETKGLGSVILHVSQMEKMSSLGGEADVLRAASNLPGIQTGADGFGGISVRGGNIDQNLYMLDGVTVYNATHGLGIFSIFNNKAIRSAQLLKGSFPAKYGGRISSIWDIQTKDGNFNNYQWEADLGLSSGKASLEGPIAKGDGSFFLSGRRAFFDLFSVPLTKNLRKKKGVDGFIDYYFYDFNMKLNHQLSRKDRIFFSFYQGLDDFKDNYSQTRIFIDTLVSLADNDRVQWGNKVGAFRWSHQFDEHMFGHGTVSYSRYFYESQGLLELVMKKRDQTLSRELLAIKYHSEIEDVSIKADFDYHNPNDHRMKFGGVLSRHIIQPGILFFNQSILSDTFSIDSLGFTDKSSMKANEADIYFQDEFLISKNILINLGMRVSTFSSLGGFYFSPQPRLFFSFFSKENRSFFTSISRMTQNLHLLSPTSIGLPKDLWVNSTKKVKPQQSWLFSSGVTQKFQNGFDLTLEGYYKDLKNLIIFKGTVLDEINSENWQDKISKGKGESYGLEVLLKKNTDRTGGWVSYAVTWTNRTFDKEINRGRTFPYRLDRRHSFSAQFLYKISSKWTFSSGLQIASGSAFTFPIQEYELVQAPGQPPSDIILRPRVIDELNSERLPVYHRLDLGFDYVVTQKKFTHNLRLGAYNVYNRKNPLYIDIREKFTPSGEIQKEAVQISLLPFFPTLRYSLQYR